jgi:8-oxo-dGTP diphosphatase
MSNVRLKRLLAAVLRHGPVTTVFGLAVRLGTRRQRVGVLALINDQGVVLVGYHTFRPWNPRGLLGGWIEPGEEPAEALRRELREELGVGVEVAVGRLLTAGQHGGRGEPSGMSLVYECSLSGTLPGDLPLELISLQWLPLAEARAVLRPIEVRAIEGTLSAGVS